ncbi:MAG: hypothetical protein HYS57_01895 [Parcubacteria group bacterium]|nr:hypothetical protein [Parcubacteria group bacterium]
METHAFWQGREPDYTKALSHLSLITEDPAYDSLPRFWKVAVQGNVAYFLMKQYEIGGKQDRSLLEQATPYLERAVALNNDLASSEAVAGWPEPFVRVVVGTKIALKYVTTIPAQHHSPYYLQGIMNESLGDTEKAVSSYRKALELHVGPAPDIERRLKNLGDGINP